MSRAEYEAHLLTPAEQYLLGEVRKEIRFVMSSLTDQIDTALAQLSSDTDAIQGVISAQNAANAVLQSALQAAQRNEAADEAELQKALDALNAANGRLTQMASPGDATPTSSDGSVQPDQPQVEVLEPEPAPTDPSDPDTGLPAPEPTAEPTPADNGDGAEVVTGDAAVEAQTQADAAPATDQGGSPAE